MNGANDTAQELRTLIAGEFPPIASAQEVGDLKSLLSMMGQDASALDDLHSWTDLVTLIEHNPDLDSKLAFPEGPSWRAFLPAWMTICLDSEISECRHNGLAAIAVGSVQRPPVSDPAKREIFETRVSRLADICALFCCPLLVYILRSTRRSEKRAERRSTRWATG